jgi:secreted PhoX family phosphatase
MVMKNVFSKMWLSSTQERPMINPKNAHNGIATVQSPNTPLLSRRLALKAGVGVAATSLFGLSACGGDSTVAATGKVTKVTFNGMANPSSDANRAMVFTNATIDITYENGTVTKAVPLSYKTIYRTGETLKDPSGNDIIAGGYFMPDGVTPLLDLSVAGKEEQFYSDAVDGTTLLKLANSTVPGISGNPLFVVTQFEYKTSNNAGSSMYGTLPEPIAVVTVDQNKTTGDLVAKQYFNVPTADVHGIWIPCAGSISPWNTHLSSEEYEPDAWAVTQTGDSGGLFKAFSRNTFGSETAANPYHYGHVPEVTVKPDGTATIRKHYCMGRISRELVQVMPDNRTVLMGDDYVGGGLFMFIADVANVLSSGTLYAAKVTQTSAAQSTDGGVFTIQWIKLGSATSQEIERLADTIWSSMAKAGTIIDVVGVATSGYTKVAVDGVTEYTKVQTGMEKAAAFLETHRYAGIKGASMEFTKLEGVALNAKDKLAYFAMSRIEKTMQDGTGDVNVKKILSGGVYAAHLNASQKDTDNNTINSAWVPTTFAVPDVAAPYTGKLLGEDIAADADGNTSNVDKISCPDNLKFSETLRTLFIGEDSGYHLNNYVWAYNVDTKVLSRVLSVPAGAECTGLQAVDNLNGNCYVMSAFQHAADWTFKTPSQDALKAAVLSNYGPSAPYGSKTVAKRAAVGYISGIPVIG